MNGTFPRPRLPVSLKRQIIAAIVNCDSEEEAKRIVELLWSKLRGDMQDRITTLIYAAKGAIEADNMENQRQNLKRSVDMLRDTEAAAR